MITGPGADTIKALEQAQHLPLVPESFAEHTMQWAAWYIGPVTLGLAIVGLGVLTARAIRRGHPTYLVLLALTGPLTAYYLWNPSITPEQIWAMRRFVPVSLPLFVLAAAVALDAGADILGRRLAEGRGYRRNLTTGLVGAGMVGMLAFPLAATFPVRSFRVQTSYLGLVEQTCRYVGPHAAILFPSVDYDAFTLSQTIRDWCGIPVAALRGPTPPAQVEAIAADMASGGRTLWVLGYNPGDIFSVRPGLNAHLVGMAANYRELEKTITRPPDHYVHDTLIIYAARVGPG
jgi:hypothetical protein